MSILGGYKREKSKNYSTDYTDYTGVFKDVVKPSNVKHQPGLINKGKYAPALRTDGGETEDRYAYRYAYRYARYATARYTTTRYIAARYATPDTQQRGPTARVLV